MIQGVAQRASNASHRLRRTAPAGARVLMYMEVAAFVAAAVAIYFVGVKRVKALFDDAR